MTTQLTPGESPGGAAPPEPDFAEARQALARLSCFAPGTHNNNPATCPACNGNDSQTIRATLDQAESEIARLREENAELRLWVENHLSEVSDVRNEMRCHRNYADKLEAELARFASPRGDSRAGYPGGA